MAHSACLDTSVLLRLLIGEPEKQAQKAQAALEAISQSGGQAIVSDLVLSETYFALQYHYQVPKKEALSTLRQVTQSEEIECSDIARSVLAHPNLHSANPGFVDRLIHTQYKATGSPMLTFEKAAKKLDQVKVL